MAAPTPTIYRPAATGAALPGWRAVLLVVEGLWAWYKRNWRATAVSSLLQPLLFLLALGIGLGSLVDAGGRAAGATGGVPYLVYLAPALLAVGAVQNATFESTYPVLSAFKWQRTYWAVTATPITPSQVALGQLSWIAVRLTLSGAVYLVVMAVVGGVRGPGVLAALVFAVLCGMAFSAPLVAYAATIENEGTAFSAVFRFVLVPMTLFAGTFFPVSQLPGALQPVAWATPLWHGVELTRGAALGTWELWPSLGHVAYLLVMLAVGVALAVWRFRVRLAR